MGKNKNYNFYEEHPILVQKGDLIFCEIYKDGEWIECLGTVKDTKLYELDSLSFACEVSVFKKIEKEELVPFYWKGVIETSHVSKRVENSKVPRNLIFNIFKDKFNNYEKKQSLYLHTCEELGKMNKTILRGVSFQKLTKLYKKNGIGLEELKSKYPKETKLYIVKNKKRFKKWVSKNIDKFLFTSKEYTSRIEENKQMTKELFEDDYEYF